ncbi:MAG: FtsQ-type POTRA domain-containing protein [Rhodothermales bacterium]|nr:FtsQ-type POTRA domain-containing protein [Rhodothermales bacterium]
MSTATTDGHGGLAPPGRKWGYVAILVVLLIGVLGVIGWRWRSDVTLTSIEVVSACEKEWRIFSSETCPDLNTSQQQIADRMSSLMGSPLYELNPTEVIEHVEGLPWIREARMQRSQSGTLTLTIAERTPVLLAMRRGRAVHFIDADGFRMPLVAGVAYDVPLLHGLTEEYDPREPVADPSVLELAAVLGDLDPSIHALISEIVLQRSEDIIFHTTVLDARGSIEVRMGRGDIRQQLVKLHAFWHQALLPDPDRRVRQIDLRFDSQIVTR